MTLPWVRLDSNIASHDKILNLLADPSPRRWQAAASYMFALGWCGAAGTDGVVTRAALRAVHGTSATARLLEKHGLWEETAAGWRVRNYAERQQVSNVTSSKKHAQRLAAMRTNCRRYHGEDCGCWRREGGAA